MTAHLESIALGADRQPDTVGRPVNWMVVIIVTSALLSTPSLFSQTGFVLLEPGLAELLAFSGACVAVLPRLRQLLSGQHPRPASVDADSLVTLGLLGAFATGEYTTVVLLCIIVDVGHAIEDHSWSIVNTADMLRKSLGTHAKVAINGHTTLLPLSSISEGMFIVCEPSEVFVCDGEITAGHSSVDEAKLNGESIPRDVHPGDMVMAGTRNITGRLTIRASRVGDQTCLGRVCSAMQRLADTKETPSGRTTQWLAGLGAFGLILAAVTYLATADIQRVISLWLVLCPCALLVSVPGAMLAGSLLLRRYGILVAEPTVLDVVADVNHIVFDKTGTLTTGRMAVSNTLVADGFSLAAVLDIAHACAASSRHPVSVAIAAYGEACGLSANRHRLVDPVEEPGYGVAAVVDGQAALLGNAGWLSRHLVAIPPQLAPLGPVAHIAVNGHYAGTIELIDPLRDESCHVISALRRQGLSRISILTGDQGAIAQHVAGVLAIRETVAHATPQMKLEQIEHWQTSGSTILYVGDGMNDSLALHAAAAGVALAKSSQEQPRHATPLRILTGGLTPLPELLRIARRTRAIARENLAVSLLYMAGLAASAACGYLAPLVAAVLHHGVTVAVLLNCVRLYWFELPGNSPKTNLSAESTSSPSTVQSSAFFAVRPDDRSDIARTESHVHLDRDRATIIKEFRS